MKRHGSLISIVRATATAKKEVCRDRGCLTGGTGCRKSEIFHQLLGHKFEKTDRAGKSTSSQQEGSEWRITAPLVELIREMRMKTQYKPLHIPRTSPAA